MHQLSADLVCEVAHSSRLEEAEVKVEGTVGRALRATGKACKCGQC